MRPHQGIAEGVNRVKDLKHRIHVAGAAQVIQTHMHDARRSPPGIIR